MAYAVRVGIRDIIWYDGPLVSAITARNGDVYIAWWIDVIERHANRWLLFKSSEEHVQGLVEERLSFWDVVPDVVFVVDIDGQYEVCGATAMKISDLPKEYMASP